MRLSFPKDIQANLSKVLIVLRYLIFLSFYILSIRLIFVSIDYSPTQPPFLWALPLLAIAILGAWRPLWSLYLFLAAIPLASGLQVLGLISPLPMLSLMFAGIYLVWVPKRLFSDRGDLSPKTGIGNLVDILSGFVLLSLIFSLGAYPTDLVLNQTLFFPPGMDEKVNGIEAAYVLLQGLFFCRIMEREMVGQQLWKIMIRILYIQASITILFSLIQLIFHAPDPLWGFAIFSPFEDIHSYGSYIAALFFIFLALVYGGDLKQKLLTGSLLGFTFLFIILSCSRVTWLAAFIVGMVCIVYKLSRRKKVLLISSLFIVLLCANLLSGSLSNSNSGYFSRLEPLLSGKQVSSDSAVYRIALWKRSLRIISDFPITGSGIGTFYKISALYEDPSAGELRDFYENAHNYFLQFASDLGLPALFVFFCIISLTYRAGLTVLPENGGSGLHVKGLLFGLSAYLVTCLTGHPLLLSNQQFLFWFIISLIVAPRTFSSHSPGDRTDPLPPDMSRFLAVLVVMVLAGYALEYGPGIWGTSHEARKYEYGFYGYEDWGGKKVRWTGKKAFVRTNVNGNVMAFDVHSSSNNIDSKGLDFKLFVDGKLWDEITFTEPETRTLKYFIPHAKDDLREIKILVSRTFVPVRLGLSKDYRHLGIAMTEIKFYNE